MRIAIIGPGAVGTTIAYELQQVLPHITLLEEQISPFTFNLQINMSLLKILSL